MVELKKVRFACTAVCMLSRMRTESPPNNRDAAQRYAGALSRHSSCPVRMCVHRAQTATDARVQDCGRVQFKIGVVHGGDDHERRI